MKKTISVLMLLTGILGKLYAQQTTNSDKLFDQAESVTGRHFYMDLGKGNKMQVNVNDLADLDKFSNMDSLIYGFLQDMKLLKDSLGDQLTTRRIDYSMNHPEQRKIRIQRFPSKGSAFIVNNKEVSALKTEQDTINFIGEVVYEAKYTLRRKFSTTRYYKLSFFVNDIGDLAGYMNGMLNQKITTIRQHAEGQWENTGAGAGTAYMRMTADKDITARSRKGYAGGGDFITLGYITTAVQNYKHYFYPSVSLGTKLILASKNFKREIGLFWEPNFMFRTNAQGRLQTYRNDFLNLTLAHGFIKDNDPKKEGPFLATISFGYLIRRKGDFFEKNTMRFGAGKISLFEGKTHIEPVIYFNNLFKGVTPGIRWIQSF